MQYGPIEAGLRKEHMAKFIREFGEPLLEDQALCQITYEPSFTEFIIKQPSHVFWKVFMERWQEVLFAFFQKIFRVFSR